jgi:hypothetical protein
MSIDHLSVVGRLDDEICYHKVLNVYARDEPHATISDPELLIWIAALVALAAMFAGSATWLAGRGERG